MPGPPTWRSRSRRRCSGTRPCGRAGGRRSVSSAGFCTTACRPLSPWWRPAEWPAHRPCAPRPGGTSTWSSGSRNRPVSHPSRPRLGRPATAPPALAVEVAVAEVAVPAAVGAALAAAVAEALRNVVRHAGVDRVRLHAWPAHGVVRVELADDGRGFDPARVRAHRRGLRESVVARMSQVGGSAAITSRPGAGTRIVLQWPTISADSPGPATADGSVRPGNGVGGAGGPARVAQLSRPADGEPGGDAVGHGGFGDLVATRYQRGSELAIVWMFAVRHVANALVAILAHRWAYRSFGAELVAWALMAGVGVAGSVRLLRRRTGAVVSWLLAAAVLAASAVATAAVASGQELTPAHWALGATGWFGVLLLLRRPIAELATLIAINAGFTLVVLLRDGAADRVGLARFLLMTYVMAAPQLGLAVVVRALDGTARRAAAAAEWQAAVRRRGQVAEALHRSRLDRYQTVRRSVVPLLVGLAGADIAYSRGVLVDLQVVGQLPVLSVSVRRALTDAPLHALASAERQARVIVFGRSNEVAVSVLADARAGEPAQLPTPLDPAVTVTVQEWEHWQWIEARWRGCGWLWCRGVQPPSGTARTARDRRAAVRCPRKRL